jgi:hypothetical protein
MHREGLQRTPQNRRAFVAKTNAEVHPSANAERQLILETGRRSMLEAQLAPE